MEACDTGISQEVYRKLIRAAVLAPTPDNNQPWRFCTGGDLLEISLDPERALASDVNSMFDLIGIGAAIENIVISASHLGFESEVAYPENFHVADSAATKQDNKSLLAATVRLHGENGTSDIDPLYDQLATRCTNRNLYKTEQVPLELRNRLAQQTHEFPTVQLDWIADRGGIGKFAKLIAASDRLRFEYQPFHQELFEQLRFTVKQAEASRDGLDVRTLELPPGVASLIYWLRDWSRMEWINRLGLGGMLTFPSWLAVRKSGAIGVLSIPSATAIAFLQSGRAFQRIWLAATAAGYALQPLGSLPIFIGQLQQLEGKNLHNRHKRLSRELQANLEQLVPTTVGRTLAMVFRIGQASSPQIRSLRRSEQDVLEFHDHD